MTNYLRSMPNKTERILAHAPDCTCNLKDHYRTTIGLNALSGKDVEREKKRRAKRSKLSKVELIS